MRAKPLLSILCGAILLLGVGDASAAVRFAAPGGRAPASSECPRTNPCSLFNAAATDAPGTALATGDEIFVEPGAYSDAAGDLGPEEVIIPAQNSDIHGAAGKPRPVISIGGAGGTPAFFIADGGVTLARLEIVSSGHARPGFALFAASDTVEGVVARADGVEAPCQVKRGLLRDSACLSTGASGSAVEVETILGGGGAMLRNVTAIATGATSRGLEVTGIGTIDLSVEAVGLLARGTAEDVLGKALSVDPHTPGTGATVTVALDHSNFADVGATNDAGGGGATVSAPGSGENIISAPQLAADGYHELPGSPTIDAGATDASSGAADVDGNDRVIGARADIGADELGSSTATALACQPSGLALGDSTICTATVASPAGSPTGVVAFASDGAGAFAGGGACVLVPIGAPNGSHCQLAYAPSAVGSGRHRLTSFYLGDAVHEPSAAAATVGVAAPPLAVPPPRTGPPAAPAPNTTLRKTPSRKTSSRGALFAFASDQAGSHFECKLDRGAFRPCRSPFKARKLKPGVHRFQVRAVGPGGAVDLTPASFTWNVPRVRLSR
jgi:hypothetical protein